MHCGESGITGTVVRPPTTNCMLGSEDHSFRVIAIALDMGKFLGLMGRRLSRPPYFTDAKLILRFQ